MISKRKHPKRGKVFFDTPDTLAKMFTRPNRLNYEQSKWFDGRGLKAIEAFESDIRRNLVEWGIGGNSIYYRTEMFWYDFALTTTNDVKLITCTRYCNRSWQRVDTWMNLHSCSIGKKWLTQEPQKSKWIELFREG